MIKKGIFTIVYMLMISFICVFIFFKIDERNVTLRLNNHNLTSEAYQITLRKNEKLKTFIRELDDSSDINNVQVHFQSNKYKNITYFYGKGNFPEPPMVSGSFFSNKDFKSIVPVVVVGQRLQKKLYKPKNQSYLHFKNYYIPVIGIMGGKNPSKLDSQIFISGGCNIIKNLNSSNFTIKIDGVKHLSSIILKKTFHAIKIEKVHKLNTFAQSGSWIINHIIQLIGLIVLSFASFIWTLIYYFRRKNNRKISLDNDYKKYIFNIWREYTVNISVGMILGVLLGLIFFKLSIYTELFTFIALLFIINSLGLYIIMYRKANILIRKRK